MRALPWLLALCAACDSKARSTDPGGGARAEQKSKEYESCGASLHCQDELRCLEHSCRRVARSTVGDYHASLGAALKSRGDLDGAVAAYSSALVRYDADKLAVPPDIDCAYGAALAAAKSNPKHAELAAKVLHRCILAVPPGAMRFTALDQLVTLADAGLDPQLLGGSKLADTYLTKGPAGPATDKLVVTVTPTPAPTGKNWPKVPDKLSGELRNALVACWEKQFAASKKPELTVTIALRVGYVGSADYEDEGGWVTKIEPAPAGASEAETCVHAVVEPAIKSLSLRESINSRVAITIK